MIRTISDARVCNANLLKVIAFSLILALQIACPVAGLVSAQDELRVMAWNIWRGGREDGEEIGPQRVIEVIKDSRADIVAMQETYGSGEIISEGLGFHFQERGTNLSIHSRFPIVEDISVFEEFKCTGALIQVAEDRQVAFYSIWLPYGKDIWLPEIRGAASVEEWQKACQPSADDLAEILIAIKQRLADDKYKDVTLMIAGDFNSMSHLDYGLASVDQYQQPVDWNTSRLMTQDNFRDAYRETNPVIDREVDVTWSPRFPEQEQERIDFVYYRSPDYRATGSEVIRTHSVQFPSDHAAVVATFKQKPELASASEIQLDVLSYNIRRGHGTDNVTDLKRSADLLTELGPDVVGLQEIDLNANRSGNQNQMRELGRQLNMHYAFGKFMDYDGGQYGMGVLSRFPIHDVEQLQLPRGNEPRVALAVTVRLPNDRLLLVVNVHFDWVRDDEYRFAQAQAVKAFLGKQSIPYVLVGDFNDRPGSRTIDLFVDLQEADKASGNELTCPADNPRVEIDFVFASPNSDTFSWGVGSGDVIDEPVVSDHRPVLAKMELEWKEN